MAEGKVEAIRRISTLATMDPTLGEGPLGLIHDAALVWEGPWLRYVGPDAGAPEAEVVHEGAGMIVLPGLVDCHTHAIWAGSRADEWRQRMAGESYAEILERGGGILSTVRHTRAASDVALQAAAAGRLAALAAGGVTTAEVKSGYGLSPSQEARLLRLALAAGQDAGVEVWPTFLGAHAIPAEWRADRAGYLEEVVGPQLRAVAGLARGVDVYIDRGAFTLEEGERVLRAGLAAGLQAKVHAEQVTHTGAAALAARLGCLSADHLERIDAAGIEAMAKAGTVAVLLPGAMLYLRDVAPPVAAMREAGLALAVASDLNPGTSPVRELLLCATLAVLTMGLTVEEALLGVTLRGAQALGLADRGKLSPGFRADIAMFRPPPGEPADAASLVQSLGGNRVALRVVGGEAS